ncbi:alpha/beta hydrolase [Geodermatophilus sp. DF01-2]|uniref:alpha/beta hydrolase n=1 Tax=Geodermatophilus sp. DF01-2 TaxID=2559610 RepID=UPI00143223A4|nr:alpha/beta hydrolase [Geodermatophilus sp. DF01_2]
MPTWLLVHPPLLGPAVLQPLAAALRRRGDEVAVPDLRAAVTTAPGWPRRWVEGAAAAGRVEVVVGFSGAGIVLPAVAVAVGARRVVWLDAVLPTGTWPDDVRELVAPLVRGGRIADWTTWWGPDAMTELVPDERVRAAVLAEGHELPADFYDVPVPVPAEWPDADVRYVHLSASYDAEAAAARARGWTVVGDGTGEHLDVANDPGRVADLLG